MLKRTDALDGILAVSSSRNFNKLKLRILYMSTRSIKVYFCTFYEDKVRGTEQGNLEMHIRNIDKKKYLQLNIPNITKAYTLYLGVSIFMYQT